MPNIFIAELSRQSIRTPKGHQPLFDLGLAKDIIYLFLGVASAVIGLEGFLLPNHFLDGGVIGVSLLARELTGLPLWALILAINLPFIYLGWKQVSLAFSLKALLAIGGLALALATVHVPSMTDDKLLTSIFGGFFIGMGIGLAVRGGGVLDGTEVLAVFLSRKLSATMGDLVLVINVAIFGAAAVLLDVQTAMYSMIAYIVASKTVDYIVVGIEEYISVNVVSDRAEELRVMLTENLGRGVTLIQARRGWGPIENVRPVEITMCIVTRLELSRLKRVVHAVDPNAFIYTYSINETIGGVIKKRALH